MDSSENQSNTNRTRQNDLKLGKHELIRGYDAYSIVLQNAVSISTNFLRAFVSNQSKDTVSIDSTQSPLFTNNVKVGFIIAKKKIRKAYQRNRIRRLLRESYRLNKKNFNTLRSNLNIIFSLTEKGTEYFINNPKTKFAFLNEEMDKLQSKIKKHFNC